MSAPLNVTNNAFRIFLGICFLILLSVAAIAVINPEEKRKEREDLAVEQTSKDIIKALDNFYKFKGRTPWADDKGSKFPSPGIPWTLASESEIGICQNECKDPGEVNKTIATISAQVELEEKDIIYIGKGDLQKDPIFACFLPQSQEYRSKTGRLSRVDLNATQLPDPKLESCPDRVSWRDIDVCYLCVSN